MEIIPGVITKSNSSCTTVQVHYQTLQCKYCSFHFKIIYENVYISLFKAYKLTFYCNAPFTIIVKY